MEPAVILTVFVAALFAATGAVKVVGLRQSLEIRDHFGMSPTLWRVIGVLEFCGALGVLLGIWVKPLGIAAGVGLVALMVGAVASRLRVRDRWWLIAGDVVVLGLVVLALAVRGAA